MQIEKEQISGLEYLSNRFNSKKAVVLFHGYGASMRDLYGLSDMIKTEAAVDWFFPDGPIKVDLGMFMEGKAWFPIDMRELELAMLKGEYRNFEDKCTDEFLASLDKAKLFISSIIKDYDEIIIGGFSQGAMISTHLMGQNIDDQKIKGYLLYSSTLLAKDKLISDLEHQAPKPFLQSHGKQDQVLDYNAAMKLFELLKLSRFEGEFISFEGAHEIPLSVIDGTRQFINKLF